MNIFVFLKSLINFILENGMIFESHWQKGQVRVGLSSSLGSGIRSDTEFAGPSLAG